MDASAGASQRHEEVTERAERETAQRLQLQRRVKDRHDRATVEQVLDRRTRHCLEKLFRQEALLEMSGCVATGKEANVYYGRARRPGDLENIAPAAIKIYKTSILIFRDREKYIAGERRFRFGYGKPRNPRKMVKLWAEKEFRNLTRLHRAGIACPEPFYLRGHVLVMQFLGDDRGNSAPRLQEALSRRYAVSSAIDDAPRASSPESLRKTTSDEVHEEPYEALYEQTVIGMRRMYQKARLVHGDLSSFNLLLWQRHVYFVDVSQSMEHDHPLALDFLRRDCIQVTAFFRRFEVPRLDSELSSGTVLSVRQLFEYVVDDCIDQDDCTLLQSYQVAQQKKRRRRWTEAWHQEEDPLSDDSVEALVFQSVSIPRRLDEIDEEQFHQVYYDRLIHLAPEHCSDSTSVSDRSYSNTPSVTTSKDSNSEEEMPDATTSELCSTLAVSTLISDADRTLAGNNEKSATSSSPIANAEVSLPCSNTFQLDVCQRRDSECLLTTSQSDAACAVRNTSSSEDASSDAYNEHDLIGDAAVEKCGDGVDGAASSIMPMNEAGTASAQEQDERSLVRCARKAWKKQVKAANRARRQNKVPKWLKRLAVKRPSRLRRYLAARVDANSADTAP